MNIVLCGMMGAGKSTVGREIAYLTGRVLCDTDGIITERHGKISQMFACFGEEYFRNIETEVTTELAQKEDLVISTGGGLVLREINVLSLKEKGKIIYLRAGVDTLLSRLKKDGERPLLEGEIPLEEKLKGLMEKRASIYEGVADYIVDVDGKAPEQIAREIIKICEA